MKLKMNFIIKIIRGPVMARAVRPPFFLPLLLALLTTLAGISSAQISAHVSGTVSDPSGAVIVGAQLIWRNTATGAQSPLRTGSDGHYSGVLPAGLYELHVDTPGFQPYSRDGIELDSAALQLDIVMAVKSQVDSMTVVVESPDVNPESAQIGETISAAKMTAVPLNGRSFTDLLAIQPGVIPASSQQPNAVVMSGCTDTPPSGDLNPGNLSVSGQRETANGFIVNGSIVEEDFNNGTAVVPNLDSIQDLRCSPATSTPSTETSAAARCWSPPSPDGNQIHGSAFEFLRNTALDARNYFATDARRLRPQPVRRNARRPDPQRQGVLLRRLPGHAA